MNGSHRSAAEAGAHNARRKGGGGQQAWERPKHQEREGVVGGAAHVTGSSASIGGDLAPESPPPNLRP